MPKLRKKLHKPAEENKHMAQPVMDSEPDQPKPNQPSPVPPKRFGSLKRPIAWKTPQFLIFVAIFSAIGGYLLIHSFALTPTDEDSSAPPAATKKLRPITHHKDKKVCADVAKGSNKVRCLARQLVDDSGKPLSTSTNSQLAYGPEQFHTAYNLPCTPGGPVQSICAQPASYDSSPLIAIVDAYSSTSDLGQSLSDYDKHFGLPDCSYDNGCLKIVNQNGNTSPLPPVDGNWSVEEDLDVKAAHMTCQTCRILLVESNAATFADLAAAVNTAASFKPVAINNSYGGSQGTDASGYSSAYDHPGIAMVVSSGDYGFEPLFPAGLASVISVGGTTLYLNTDNTWANEPWWNSDGSWACSRPDITPGATAPQWQKSLPNWSLVGYNTVYAGTNYFRTCNQYNAKAIADVSADADPNTGFDMGNGTAVGGTSLSAPIIAGIIGLTNGPPAGYSQPAYIPYSAFNSSNSRDINDDSGWAAHCLSRLSDPTDITSCQYIPSLLGYDMMTGLGSPNGISGFIANGQPPSSTTCSAGTTGTPPNCVTNPPTPDTTSPSTATNLSASINSSTSAFLSWQAGTDNVAVTGYDVYRGSTKIATINTSAYLDNALKANSSYTYSVVAFDAAGNHSAKSVSLSFKTPAFSTTNGSVTGRLTDITSGKPLSGVKVYYVLGGRNKNVSTNSSGYYTISNLPPATYSLTYSLTNYQAQQAPVTVSASTNTSQNIGLYHL